MTDQPTAAIVRRLRAGDEPLALQAIETFKGSSPPMQHVTDFVSNEHNYLYVATVDEKPVGFLLAYRLERCDREQAMMFLYEIEVLSSHRRRGIATALVDELKTTCRREQCMKLFVVTNESNLPAVALYRSAGGRRTMTDEALFVTSFPKEMNGSQEATDEL